MWAEGEQKVSLCCWGIAREDPDRPWDLGGGCQTSPISTLLTIANKFSSICTIKQWCIYQRYWLSQCTNRQRIVKFTCVCVWIRPGEDLRVHPKKKQKISKRLPDKGNQRKIAAVLTRGKTSCDWIEGLIICKLANPPFQKKPSKTVITFTVVYVPVICYAVWSLQMWSEHCLWWSEGPPSPLVRNTKQRVRSNPARCTCRPKNTRHQTQSTKKHRLIKKNKNKTQI